MKEAEVRRIYPLPGECAHWFEVRVCPQDELQAKWLAIAQATQATWSAAERAYQQAGDGGMAVTGGFFEELAENPPVVALSWGSPGGECVGRFWLSDECLSLVGMVHECTHAAEVFTDRLVDEQMGQCTVGSDGRVESCDPEREDPDVEGISYYGSEILAKVASTLVDALWQGGYFGLNQRSHPVNGIDMMPAPRGSAERGTRSAEQGGEGGRS